jgi:hypothetical protein
MALAAAGIVSIRAATLVYESREKLCCPVVRQLGGSIV